MDDSCAKFEAAIDDSGNTETKACDQTSVLPDKVIHHIMSLLHPKDFINTCSLSKRWNRLWCSVPVLQFRQSNWPHDRTLKSEEIGEAQQQRFVNFVDRSIQKFIDMRKHHQSIQKFDLQILRMDTESVSHIDRWLKFATQNHVQNLYLSMPRGSDENMEFYNLPVETVFASQSLQSVLLSGCELNLEHVKSSIHCPSLRKLALLHVYLDNNTIRNLFRCCPSITTFRLSNAWGLKKLHISRIPSVETVEVHSNTGDLEEVYIDDAPMLRSIELWYRRDLRSIKLWERRDRTFTYNFHRCSALTSLSFNYCFLTNKHLQDVLSGIPSLESLYIRNCMLDRTIEISGRKLKALTLIYSDVSEVKIDNSYNGCFSFSFEGRVEAIPHLHLKSWSCHCQINLHNACNDVINANWFLVLRQKLVFLNCKKSIRINLHEYIKISDLKQQFKEITLPSSFEVEDLTIYTDTSSLDFTALLDRFLQLCHPSTISIQSNHIAIRERIQSLLEKLWMDKDIESCCVSNNIKCWRHCLEYIVFESNKVKEGMEVSTFRLAWKLDN
ncbi:F-box/LRR-repeat protein [Tripterygium wilfordii]|uniref:F-box/LRR-repeat protein n=1 Tax=Tripterygium wilfordii TaxID=458696 RepID=A0A7J7C8P7_TRIWF|nr:putative F-box/LRR-repeat protein At3g58880 [Tripterygium wilfordii]KAF5730470.1 F-box/LRR-repeat protein [Tripterygium wilfordii]